MVYQRTGRPAPGSPDETPEQKAARIAAVRAGVARRRAAVRAAMAAGEPPPPPKRSPRPACPAPHRPRQHAGASVPEPDPIEEDRAPADDRDRLEIRRALERGLEPRRIADEFGAPIAVVNAIRFAMEAA